MFKNVNNKQLGLLALILGGNFPVGGILFKNIIPSSGIIGWSVGVILILCSLYFFNRVTPEEEALWSSIPYNRKIGILCYLLGGNFAIGGILFKNIIFSSGIIAWSLSIVFVLCGLYFTRRTAQDG